jgi:hypothetical protein
MKLKTDHVAIGVAVACGIHCYCIPILLGMSAIAGFIGRVSEPVEYVFLGCSFLLGTTNLLYSWRKRHHHPGCLALFCAGFVMVAARDHMPLSGIAGIAGAVLVATAHFRNLRLCRRSRCISSCGAATAPSSE